MIIFLADNDSWGWDFHVMGFQDLDLGLLVI